MRVILRNPFKDLYFLGPNMWTNDRSKAFDFERMEPAIDLVRRAGLNDLELVILINRATGDIHLPLDKADSG